MTRSLNSPSSRTAFTVQGLMYLTWAATWPVGKWALHAWTPLGLIAVRHALAGGALLLVAAGGARSALPNRAVVAVGLLQYFAYYFLSYVALSRLDAGTVALVSGCYPVFVAVFAGRTALGRGPNAREWLALSAVIAGSVLVASTAGAAPARCPAAAPLWLYFAAFLAAVCLAVATTVTARSLRSAAPLAEVSHFVGAAMLVGSGAAFLGSLFAQQPLSTQRLDWWGAAALGFLSLFGSVGVFLLHSALLRNQAAWKVAAGYPLVPALALLLGALLLGEIPTSRAAPGILLLFAGLVGLTWAGSGSRRTRG